MHRLGMKWLILLGVFMPCTFTMLVIKSDGMFNVRMTSESCGLPLHSDVGAQDIEENKSINNFTQLNSGSCGWYNKWSSLRISGGGVYPANEFPFISALVKCSVSGGCQPFCGGSILTRSHILTAAHCTDDLDTVKLFVLVGAYDIFSKQSTSIQVGSITRHSSYDRRTLMNDIAVLTLITPITFNKNVGPVCLPDSELDVGDQVKILGWGADKYKGHMSPKPKEMNTKVISAAICSAQWGTCVRPTKPIQMCTHSEDATPCQGDSGGPVVWLDPQKNQYSLVGIVSFGPQCTEVKAAVHTKVMAFLPWIQQQIQGTYGKGSAEREKNHHFAAIHRVGTCPTCGG